MFLDYQELLSLLIEQSTDGDGSLSDSGDSSCSDTSSSVSSDSDQES